MDLGGCELCIGFGGLPRLSLQLLQVGRDEHAHPNSSLLPLPVHVLMSSSLLRSSDTWLDLRQLYKCASLVLRCC